MSRKLLMNNHSLSISDDVWDYEKISETPLDIGTLCSEYIESNNLRLSSVPNGISVFEVEVFSVNPSTSSPQFIILTGNNEGQKLYYSSKTEIKIGNNVLTTTAPTLPYTIRVEYKDSNISFYINGDLLIKTPPYSSTWISYTGVDDKTVKATAVRYKKNVG